MLYHEPLCFESKLTVHTFLEWLAWSPWSSCSTTCGHGVFTASRVCDTGFTEDCWGAQTRTTDCPAQEECPSEYMLLATKYFW